MIPMNNRELAILIWAIPITLFLLSKKETWRSLKSILQLLIGFKLFSIILSATLYTAIITYTFSKVGVVNLDDVKVIILWFVFSGLHLLFNSVPSSAKEYLFKDLLLANLKITLILEFVVNLYSFPLLVELITVPLLTIIILMDALAQEDEKLAPIRGLLSALQTIFGFAIIAYVGYQIIINIRGLANIDLIYDFLLPPLMTFSFMPFLYLFVLMGTYEMIFMRLRIGAQKEPEVLKLAKRNIFKFINISHRKAVLASRMATFNLITIRTKEDVYKMIETYKQL